MLISLEYRNFEEINFSGLGVLIGKSTKLIRDSVTNNVFGIQVYKLHCTVPFVNYVSRQEDCTTCRICQL